MRLSGPVLFSTRRGWGVSAAALLLGALGWVAPAAAQSPSIVVASTTSTEQSGLFGHILPEFSQASGIAVKVVALGTGQAIDMARRGDADVLFVHDKAAEEKFVADGFAPRRFNVMYNDFVLVGPKADPAQLRGKDIVAALRKVAATQAPFVSRGDKSGTHAAELRYWKAAGIKLLNNEPSLPEDMPISFPGYKACGCGMGPALNMADPQQSLWTALESASVPPCDRYACRYRSMCAAQRLQCRTFVHYVATGKSCIPQISPELCGLNEQEAGGDAPAR